MFYRLSRFAACMAAGILLTACGSSASGGAANPVPTVTVAGTTVTATVTAAGATATKTVTTTKTAPTEAPKTVVITTSVVVTETEEAAVETTADDDGDVPTGLAVGKSQGITSTTSDGAATIHVLSVKRATDGGGEFGEKPSNGNYLLIDIEYLATSGTYEYNPFDWTIRDPDGRTFDPGFGSYAGKVTRLNSGTVAKGSKARGTIVFDAPKGPLTLEFGGGFGNAPASWKIP